MSEKLEHYRAGRELHRQQQFEAAIEKYQAAAALDEKWSAPLHALVQCYTELKQHEQAIELGKKIIQMEPDDVHSYTALSRAYQQAGMIHEAEYALAQGRMVRTRI